MGWKDAPVKGAKSKWESAQVVGQTAPKPTPTQPDLMQGVERVISQPQETFSEARKLWSQENTPAGNLAAIRGGIQYASQPFGLAAEYLKTPATPLEKIPTPTNPFGQIMGAIRGTPPAKFAVSAAEMLSKIPSAIAGGISSVTAEPLLNLADKSGETGKQFTQTAETVAPFAAPWLTSKGFKLAAKALPKETGLNLIAKAGKFTGTPEQVLKKAEIAYKEGINPANAKALDKLETSVSQIDKDVNSFMKSSDFIKTDDALRYIEPLIEKVKRSEITPESAVESIRSQTEQIYKERGEQIPADLAQQIKKGIYTREKAAYETQQKTGKPPELSTEVEMRVARGILGELKKLYPETEKLLSKQSDLLSIRKDVRSAVRREMIKSNIPNAFLMAISPKWWLAKTISNSKTLEYNLGRLLYKARGGSEVTARTPGVEPPPYNRTQGPPSFGTSPNPFSPPTPTMGAGAPPFVAQPVSTQAVMTKQPTIEELSNLKMTDIPPEKFNEVMSYRMEKDRARAVSDVENSPHYSTVKPILDEAGMRIESIKDMGGVPTVEFTDPNSMYTTTLPISEMTVENIKAKVASKIKQEPSAKITADDLSAYRQYISGGGNLNISEWKKSLGR